MSGITPIYALQKEIKEIFNEAINAKSDEIIELFGSAELSQEEFVQKYTEIVLDTYEEYTKSLEKIQRREEAAHNEMHPSEMRGHDYRSLYCICIATGEAKKFHEELIINKPEIISIANNLYEKINSNDRGEILEDTIQTERQGATMAIYLNEGELQELVMSAMRMKDAEIETAYVEKCTFDDHTLQMEGQQQQQNSANPQFDAILAEMGCTESQCNMPNHEGTGSGKATSLTRQ